ncbi:glycosyl hydrolase family 35 protein (macronuclear) [Tetrahymena thermophila SB210]|uniref:Glycosyl hydrolase family 35 protein n=1 Tax=Tetrahymena thermophila (strain SB210) TaxID=312017 RepID=Q237M2_TETTS|nr:glycosyl hydrolase family 35 protein [Tetrahymena thermophila SB210]EAR92719.1 glycosyl hydrolase family 35 protein [Tetrahymena thermophila SB210]|eukprot:XP_001012964.1 glycosyl hydrolase family 35 protein [Tetrahymena thermophila SB210]
MNKVALIASFLAGLSILSISFVYLNQKDLKAEVIITNPPFNTTFPQTFELKDQQFLLNGQPLYVAAGEIHYSRVPSQYWRTRVQTIKALGLNTLSVYIMWNHHEVAPGVFDFSSPDRNLRNFLQIALEEQMYVLIRPGPYVCAEWDFGGQPFWLLKENVELRSTDPKYIQAITPYINRVAQEIQDYQITRNGTVLMVQIENEFGYYGSDNTYPLKLKQIWDDTKMIQVPYYTADGGSQINTGHVPGAAFGLNPGTHENDYQYAHSIEFNMPVMSSETYPGWLTHWADNWAGRDISSTVSEFENLVWNQHSFSMYMVFGGSNFGLTAGANNDNSDTAFQPDITSYDYDAPINEQGAPTDKFYALREMFKSHFNWTIPNVPQIQNLTTVDQFTPQRFGSLRLLYNSLPKVTFQQAQSFEVLNQNQGIIVYTFQVPISNSSQNTDYTLSFDKIRDFAKVYVQVNSSTTYNGTINRMNQQNSFSFSYSGNATNATVTIFVEALGHVNFGHTSFDNKGIIGNIYFQNKNISNISHTLIPLQNIPDIIPSPSAVDSQNSETFFKGTFKIIGQIGDTYLNMSNYTKGYVWVNGFNLGRYWNIGPQQKLFCPATILKQNNEIVILDLLQNTAAPLQGELTLH